MKPALFKRFVGDRQLAAEHLGLARSLMQRMRQYLGALDGAKTWVLTNGAVIRTQVAGGLEIVTIDVTRVIQAGCRDLPVQVLYGFATWPSASDGSQLPDPAGAIEPVEGVKQAFITFPRFTDSAPNHSIWFYSAEQNTVAARNKPARYYGRRIKDTCDNVIEWYPQEETFYGNQTWLGPEKDVLSWHGPSNRYFLESETTASFTGSGSDNLDFTERYPGLIIGRDSELLTDPQTEGCAFVQGGSTEKRPWGIGYKGRRIKVESATDEFSEASLFTHVKGACLTRSAGGTFLIWVIGNLTSNSNQLFETVYRAKVAFDDKTGLVQHISDITDLASRVFRITPSNSNDLVWAARSLAGGAWCFNESGTKAVATRFAPEPRKCYLNISFDGDGNPLAAYEITETPSLVTTQRFGHATSQIRNYNRPEDPVTGNGLLIWDRAQYYLDLQNESTRTGVPNAELTALGAAGYAAVVGIRVFGSGADVLRALPQGSVVPPSQLVILPVASETVSDPLDFQGQPWIRQYIDPALFEMVTFDGGTEALKDYTTTKSEDSAYSFSIFDFVADAEVEGTFSASADVNYSETVVSDAEGSQLRDTSLAFSHGRTLLHPYEGGFQDITGVTNIPFVYARSDIFLRPDDSLGFDAILQSQSLTFSSTSSCSFTANGVAMIPPTNSNFQCSYTTENALPEPEVFAATGGGGLNYTSFHFIGLDLRTKSAAVETRSYSVESSNVEAEPAGVITTASITATMSLSIFCDGQVVASGPSQVASESNFIFNERPAFLIPDFVPPGNISYSDEGDLTVGSGEYDYSADALLGPRFRTSLAPFNGLPTSAVITPGFGVRGAQGDFFTGSIIRYGFSTLPVGNGVEYLLDIPWPLYGINNATWDARGKPVVQAFSRGSVSGLQLISAAPSRAAPLSVI